MHGVLDLRMSTIQPIFLSVVDVENCRALHPVLRKVLDELDESRYPHTIIGSSRSC